MNEDTFILFGATGDLAKEKIYPALKHILGVNVIGYGRNSDVGNSLNSFDYIAGDYKNPENLLNKLKSLNTKNLYFYLALPPVLYIDAIRFIKKYFKIYQTKIALEKPFGTNLSEALKIEKLIKKYDLNDFYLIDHYLAKTVIRIIISKKVNSNNIKRIELFLLEKNNVSRRGKFYDQIGVIKDVGQNHLLNTIDLFFKTNSSPDFIKKVQYRKRSLIIGQYKGYDKTDGVKNNSQTATYFSAGFKYKNIDIILKSGKALNKSNVIFNILDKNNQMKTYSDNNKKSPTYLAHLNIIKDFINNTFNYSLDLESAVNSWRVIKKIEDDLEKAKLIIYPKNSSVDIVEKLAEGESN